MAKTIKPQRGQQEAFCSSSADITIGGGGAGGGKTFGLLLESLRYVHEPLYRCVIFRRTTEQIRYPGSLWDESFEVYPHVGGQPKQTLEWFFPSGAVIRFAHMERETDRYNWDGAQLTNISFDQLEHFTRSQFFYLFSRTRSPLDVPSYIRATCNPDPDSFLASFLDWWIDDEGWAIKERSGVLRYFVRDGNDIVWAGTRKEHLSRGVDDPSDITSVTFVPSTVWDNPINLEKNPRYVGNLRSLDLVDRMRLLGEGDRGGNWKIRAEAGKIFQRSWFPVVDGVSSKPLKTVRYYDFAATSEEEVQRNRSDPSWTGDVKMSLLENGLTVIHVADRFRASPAGVEKRVVNTASQDGRRVSVGFDWDPGQAGKAQVQHYLKLLLGYDVRPNRVTESKAKRAAPLSAQAEQGNVLLMRGAWNDGFLTEAQNFDGTRKCQSDRVDAASGGFYQLTSGQAPLFEPAKTVNEGYFKGI